jgi:hypothetical protein
MLKVRPDAVGDIGALSMLLADIPGANSFYYSFYCSCYCSMHTQVRPDGGGDIGALYVPLRYPRR